MDSRFLGCHNWCCSIYFSLQYIKSLKRNNPITKGFEMEKDMTITDYIVYIKTAIMGTWILHKKSILLLSTTTGVVFGLIDQIAFSLGVHVLFLILYFTLVVADMISGIASSRLVNKEAFVSSKFLKKVLLAGFSLFMLLINEWLIVIFTNHNVRGSTLLPELLNIIIFLTNITKVAFMLMFIIYELTSIRENFVKLQLNEFVRVLDLLITPLTKLDNYLNDRFETVINKKEEDVENNNL